VDVGVGNNNDGTDRMDFNNNNSDYNNMKKLNENNFNSIDEKMEVVENGINLESVSISLTEMDQEKEPETKPSETVKVEKSVKPTKYEKSQLLKKNIFTEPVITNLSKYFLERVDPSPRINPCLMVRYCSYCYCYYCCCCFYYRYCFVNSVVSIHVIIFIVLVVVLNFVVTVIITVIIIIIIIIIIVMIITVVTVLHFITLHCTSHITTD
jgi:hypothetical protein